VAYWILARAVFRAAVSRPSEKKPFSGKYTLGKFYFSKNLFFIFFILENDVL
jgi:hypothetical protein